VLGVIFSVEQDGRTYVLQFDDTEHLMSPTGDSAVIGIDSIRLAERLEGATPLPMGDDPV